VRSCISAAHELIALAWDGVHEGVEGAPALPWWYAIFYLYTAGTVILAILLTPSLCLIICRDIYPEDGESTTRPQKLLQTSWERCVEALSVYQRSGSVFAKRCLWILCTIYDQRTSQEEHPGIPQDSGIAGGIGASEAYGEPAPPDLGMAAAERLSSMPLAMSNRPMTRAANGSGTITPTTWQVLANAAFAGGAAVPSPAVADHHHAAADEFLLDQYWPAGNMDWLHNLPDGLDRTPVDVDVPTESYSETAMPP
jgi:hypothetical protein